MGSKFNRLKKKCFPLGPHSLPICARIYKGSHPGYRHVEDAIFLNYPGKSDVPFKVFGDVGESIAGFGLIEKSKKSIIMLVDKGIH